MHSLFVKKIVSRVREKKKKTYQQLETQMRLEPLLPVSLPVVVVEPAVLMLLLAAVVVVKPVVVVVVSSSFSLWWLLMFMLMLFVVDALILGKGICHLSREKSGGGLVR